jgi:RHS repeat-associated protein
LAVEYLFDGWGALSQVRNATTTSLVYYTLNEQDASGAVRRATLGNGLVEQYDYEATTGRLASIKTGPSGSATLQNLEFEWDLAGNLEQRVDQLLSRTDAFDYDALDRLTSVVRNSSTVFSAGYDALGNLTSKTGVSGTYTYGGSRPHAVTAIGSSMTFGYDANGNMTDRDTTEIDWTSYNLPSRIERASGEYSEFLYGADRSRYVQVEGAGAVQSTRHYASPGLFEVLTWNSGASRVDYHYIHAHGRAVAQFTTSNVEADELQYLHRDHQGSVVATTASNGTLLDRFEYDPFGVRTTTVGSDERMHRGYTGHEELAALDLVHMNGRVQDPLLGRFLSPDPFVQAPYQLQSYNRYAYGWNNPATLVDPSGFQTSPCTEEMSGIDCDTLVAMGRDYNDIFHPAGASWMQSGAVSAASQFTRGPNGVWLGGTLGYIAHTERRPVTCVDDVCSAAGPNTASYMTGSKVSEVAWSAWNTLIPGAANWGYAETYARQGRYGWATAHAVSATAEAFLAVVTLGTYQGLSTTARVGASTAARGSEATIARIAQGHADSGVEGLAPYLSQKELGAVLSGSRATSAILGQGVHRATAASLQASYPGQYVYLPRARFDFIHLPTGQALELTTFGQAAGHANRGANLVLYNLAK